MGFGARPGSAQRLLNVADRGAMSERTIAASDQCPNIALADSKTSVSFCPQPPGLEPVHTNGPLQGSEFHEVKWSIAPIA